MKDQIICPRCSGRGKLPNPATAGTTMRRLRESSGISLRKVAKECGISAPFLSDLELGDCHWTNTLEVKVRLAIKRLSKSH
jgi:transcriptional regulator with XRE-family HTH domain